MPYYQRKTVSGNVTEIEVYHSIRRAGKNYLPRTANMNTTSEEKQVINIQKAREKLTRTLNCNFSKQDAFIRLSYRSRGIEKEIAIKNFRNFIRKLKRYIKKNNLPELKYVAVTENGKGKIHHHIVMNFTDANVIRELWTFGGVYIVDMWSSDFTHLAMYITKETIRNEHGKRWSQSRNLEKPVVEVKEPKGEKRNGPRVPRGYTLMESKCYVTSLGHKNWYMKAVKNGTEYFDSGG